MNTSVRDYWVNVYNHVVFKREKKFDKMDLLPPYCERMGEHQLGWKQKKGRS